MGVESPQALLHFSTHVGLALLSRPPRMLEVSAQSENIEIVIGDVPNSQMLVDGEPHGFGLPSSRLDASSQFVSEPIPTLAYRIEQRGWITDLDASATIRIPRGALEQVMVHLQRGNIRVIDLTPNHEVGSGAIRLDLHTAAEHVQQPDQ
jgi:hypothetical protein